MLTTLRRHILASADVFLTDLSETTLLRLGLNAASLTAVRPDLIQGQVSGFGENNKFSHLAADGERFAAEESLVAAAIGRMMVFEGVGRASWSGLSGAQGGDPWSQPSHC